MTSEARRREQDDSGEYSDASQDIEHNNSSNDGPQESDYDSQGSDSESSEREGENQPEAERRVDDDEDRSNPQYIPKRGTFYEHDDRTAASGEETANTTSETASEKKESESPSERRRPPRKSDTVNKWSHDKYIENEQIPKSRDELVAIYGYDIRNEDAPPHARRNRRYGRGPNKYTRTWEDEEAYRRQSATQQPRKPPNPEDFPDLDTAAKKPSRKVRAARPRSKSQPAGDGAQTGPGSTEGTEEGGKGLRRHASIKTRSRGHKPKPHRNNTHDNMPAIENLTITTNLNNSQGAVGRKVNAVAQQRPVPTDQARKKHNQPPQAQQPTPVPNKSPPQQQQNAQQQKAQHNQQQQQNAGGESRGGIKRYSSLRQRPLGDSYTPQTQQQSPQQQPQQQQPQQPQQQPQQQQQQQHRYHAGPGEYTGAATPHQGSPAPHPPHLMHQVHRNAPVPAPSPPQTLAQQLPQPQLAQQHPQQQHATQQHNQQQQVRLNMLEQQQLVHQPHTPHHNIHNIPQTHAIGQLQPTQGYAPPAMMPAQYMQSGSGAVFGGAAMYAQPPAPYQHQMYPHHNYVPASAPLVPQVAPASAGGVTYYNCAEQEQQQPRAQRRPTAAIPIVRPNQQPQQQQQQQQQQNNNDRAANSTEKDNIDRIVENMFVRKPWPAHGPDKEKSSDSRNSQEPASKESSQPNSLTSSSISTDSKPSEKTDKEEKTQADTEQKDKDVEAQAQPESISEA